MNLASLIQKGVLRELATATPATPATDGAEGLRTVASVATVAVATAQGPAANDRRAVFVGPPVSAEVDPDRWAWPSTAAMNGSEIDTFIARMSHFSQKAIQLEASERLADRLVMRDRDCDDRRNCLECMHLQRANGWRCGNWQRAGVAIRARDATLAADFVNLLQRCDGFADAVAT
jgi:hypothetical protein